MVVVAKLTIDRTDYRTEHRSLPEHYNGGIDTFVAFRTLFCLVIQWWLACTTR